MSGLYEKMEAMGLDMSWYNKSKGVDGSQRNLPPLTDDYCGRLSIYLLEPNGNLYTVAGDGNRYMTVRHTEARPKTRVYVCAHCKAQFSSFKEAKQHYAQDNQAA